MSERASSERRAGTPSLAACCSLLARMIVGGVLLYAGFMKAVGPSAEFAALIEAYKILPPSLLSPLALALPWIEMWLGTFLIFGFFTRPSAAAATLLFTVFLAALASTLVRGIDLASCGCFGADALSPRYTIILDSVLMVLSIILTVLSKDSCRWSLDTYLDSSPTKKPLQK